MQLDQKSKLNSMLESGDHWPSMRAQQQAEEQNRIIAELDKHAAPLHWMVLVIVAILTASQLWQGWKHYADLAAVNEAMVQCLNGRMVGIGDAVVRCDVRQLVAGGAL